jgi:integrase
MAKTTERLKDLQIKKLSKAGSYADGKGLYLQVSTSGSKSWFYRYETNGRAHKCGLGAYPDISIKKARTKAAACRTLRDEGIDPIEHKKRQNTARELDKFKGKTFKECALDFMNSHKAGWKNRKHESQWRTTLETYAYPFIGKLAVQDVDVGHVLEILEPIWHKKTETASRVRQRIENILDWAKVRKYRTGENPAVWRGHLDKILPARTKVQKVKHHPAMPYRDVPNFFRVLRNKDIIAAKALAFTILTAARNGESREARWNEIDTNSKEWVLPEERMKAKKEHKVPLSDLALNILKEAKPHGSGVFVFEGHKKNRPISETALRKLLKKYHPTLTIHGFRSSFREWCAEMTSYPREVAEMSLAHSLKDKVEAAYQRSDLLDKRRKLMDEWSEFCLNGNNTDEVIPLKKKVL